MSEYDREDVDTSVWDEFPEAIDLCYICKSRPITADNVQTMLRGGKCICRQCGAIHAIVESNIGILGFRV